MTSGKTTHLRRIRYGLWFLVTIAALVIGGAYFVRTIGVREPPSVTTGEAAIRSEFSLIDHNGNRVTEADFLRGLAEMEPQLALVRRSRRRSVGALLGDLGLRDQYEAALCEHHDVSWEELVRMDDAQLRECGVDKVGHRVRILAAAARESAGVAL